jgi:hypothetical protein
VVRVSNQSTVARFGHAPAKSGSDRLRTTYRPGGSIFEAVAHGSEGPVCNCGIRYTKRIAIAWSPLCPGSDRSFRNHLFDAAVPRFQSMLYPASSCHLLSDVSDTCCSATGIIGRPQRVNRRAPKQHSLWATHMPRYCSLAKHRKPSSYSMEISVSLDAAYYFRNMGLYIQLIPNNH